MGRLPIFVCYFRSCSSFCAAGPRRAWVSVTVQPGGAMGETLMRYDYAGVIADYDPARDEWTIEDTTKANVRAWTQEPELAYHAMVAFAAEDPDDDSGPYRDSGDEDPHA